MAIPMATNNVTPVTHGNISYSTNTNSLTLNANHTTINGNLLIQGSDIIIPSIMKDRDFQFIDSILCKDRAGIMVEINVDDFIRSLGTTHSMPSPNSKEKFISKPILIFYYPQHYSLDSIDKFTHDISNSSIQRDYHILYMPDLECNAPWVDIVTVENLTEMGLDELKQQIKDKLKK